jgi:Protein of unknown function (DUF2934)
MSDDLAAQRTKNSRHEEISFRARRLWNERGSPIGSPEEDWFGAKEEIRGEQAARDEMVRARNKAVRESRHAPEAGGVHPFCDHSGQL